MYEIKHKKWTTMLKNSLGHELGYYVIKSCGSQRIWLHVWPNYCTLFNIGFQFLKVPVDKEADGGGVVCVGGNVGDVTRDVDVSSVEVPAAFVWVDVCCVVKVFRSVCTRVVVSCCCDVACDVLSVVDVIGSTEAFWCITPLLCFTMWLLNLDLSENNSNYWL